MKQACSCGVTVWDGPGNWRPALTETIVCWHCGADCSLAIPIINRLRYFAHRLAKRWRLYGLVGLRVRVRHLGWHRVLDLKASPDNGVPLPWCAMWRGTPWYAMWHCGRSRDAVMKARERLFGSTSPVIGAA